MWVSPDPRRVWRDPGMGSRGGGDSLARPKCGSRPTHIGFGVTQAVGSRRGGGGLAMEGVMSLPGRGLSGDLGWVKFAIQVIIL